MNEQLTEVIQGIASSKTALLVGVSAASAPAWINMLTSQAAQATVVGIGMVLSVTIICVNVQTLFSKVKKNKIILRQEQVRSALLEYQAKEKGLDL